MGPQELRRYWPDFTFQVTDLTQYSDEQLRGAVVLRSTLWLMKYIADVRLRETLPRVFNLVFDLAQQETGLQYLETFLRYIMAAGQHVTQAELCQIVVDVFSQRGGTVMGTIAEQLIEQGIEKGRQEGRQEGLLEGAQALRNSILTILQIRFSLSGADAQTTEQRLAQVSDLSQLEALVSHALQDSSQTDFARRLP